MLRVEIKQTFLFWKEINNFEVKVYNLLGLAV
jgi:hypothetical protein